jgi:RimJ/RimL family protein N-acetyltransferase
MAAEDCRRVWKWANDQAARQASFCSDHISWDTHREWFEKRLHNPSCRDYVASSRDGLIIGLARFDVTESNSEISVSIDADHRGVGYGERLIALGTQRFIHDTRAEVVTALIKPDNDRSLRTFRKAGYRPCGRIVVQGHKAERLVFERQNR